MQAVRESRVGGELRDESLLPRVQRIVPERLVQQLERDRRRALRCRVRLSICCLRLGVGRLQHGLFWAER